VTTLYQNSVGTNPEVRGQLFVLFPRHGHAFDERVLLRLQADDGLEEDDALVLLGEHAHQALHEILRRHVSKMDVMQYLWYAYPNLVPHVVVRLEHGEVMLNGNNEAVAVDELVVYCAGKVRARAHRDNRAFRQRVILAIAKRTCCERCLRPLVV
jgi:hypothetical protein